MRKITAFYAWQSDTPERFNRHLIRIALQDAAKRITDSMTDVELVVDYDTAGVPGQPPITETILRKIDACDIFIPDVSFVASMNGGKLVPNPNVMTEYGYALRAKTHAAMMPVMNTAFGPPSELPFDMGHLRHPMQYHVDPKAKPAQRRAVRQALSQQIEEKLRFQIVATQPPLIAPNPFRAAEAFEDGATFVPIDTTFRIASASGATVDLSFRKGAKAFLRVQPRHEHPLLTRSEAVQALLTSGMGTLPLGWYRYKSSCRGSNKWGECSYICEPDPADGDLITISQLMLERELWSIETNIVDHKFYEIPVILIEEIEQDFTETIGRYMQTAQKILQIQPPLRIIAGLTDISGCQLQKGYHSFSKPIFDPKVVTEIDLQSYDLDAGTILIPFYERIWEAAYLRRPAR